MRYLCLLVFLGPICLTGCGGVQPREIEVEQVSALEEAKQILNNYAGGAPVTSEADGFAALASRVEAENAEHGKIVKAAFDKISANPNSQVEAAKSALKELP